MLAGTRAIVTGATSGIGLATVKVFRKHGALVCATGRNASVLQALSDETGCSHVVADLTADNQCERAVKEAVGLLDGSLTSLVNCAGVLKPGAIACLAVS